MQSTEEGNKELPQYGWEAGRIIAWFSQSITISTMSHCPNNVKWIMRYMVVGNNIACI